MWPEIRHIKASYGQLRRWKFQKKKKIIPDNIIRGPPVAMSCDHQWHAGGNQRVGFATDGPLVVHHRQTISTGHSCGGPQLRCCLGSRHT